MVAGYVVVAVSSQPSIEGVVSAVVFLAIAATGFLYAWRLGAGGTLE
jgi:NADH:ubiquinone oxidoreductase subunit 3 (subunit A)